PDAPPRSRWRDARNGLRLRTLALHAHPVIRAPAQVPTGAITAPSCDGEFIDASAQPIGSSATSLAHPRVRSRPAPRPLRPGLRATGQGLRPDPRDLVRPLCLDRWRGGRGAPVRPSCVPRDVPEGLIPKSGDRTYLVD